MDGVCGGRRGVRPTRDAGEPLSAPIRIPNLLATILHTLVDVGEVRLLPDLPREIGQTMTGWNPIHALVT